MRALEIRWKVPWLVVGINHRRVAADLSLVIGFTMFTTLCARVILPLPFTPVPVTAQSLSILLGALVLGRHLGLLSVLLYVVQGAVGLPVFGGGEAGLSHLVGPTGGYLLGFVLATYAVGLIADRGLCRRPLGVLLASAVGTLLVYGVGVPWLALSVHVSFDRAVVLGMLPFVFGDALKLVLVGATYIGARRIVSHVRT